MRRNLSLWLQGNDQRAFWFGMGGILLVWTLCYLPNLRSSPGWYGDEFISLMAGNAILNGDFSNRALKYSFFSTFTNYQPWGAVLYSLSSKLFAGGDLLGARLLSVLLALILTLMVYVELFRRKKGWYGFCAALLILLAPQNTIHFRWVYPHFFVSLGVVLIGLLLSRDHKQGFNDWMLGIGCALAAIGHLLVVHVLAATGVSQIRRPKAWLKIILPPAVLVFGALVIGYWSSGPLLFLDLGELATGYLDDSNRSTLADKILNIFRFFSTDWFHLLLLLSFVGLFLLRRWALLTFTSILCFAVIQNRPELPVFYYQSMIFVPLLCLNLILSIYGLAEWLQERIQNGMPLLISRAVCLLIPMFFLFPALQNSFAGTHVPRNNYWVAPRHGDLEGAAQWVNRHTSSQDLVIAFWDVGWLLRCRWTDPMQCAIWSYGNFPYFYNRTRPRSEFLFPANLAEAKYIIVGPLDLRWAYGQGTIPMLLKEFKVETWPTVFQTETTRVLANPGI